MKQLLPEFEINLKVKGKKSELKTITSSSDAAEVCRMCFDDGKINWVEEFIVVGLSRANNVQGFYKVSSGGVTGTVADPRVIFQFALLSNATSIILAHNHPSGNLNPSEVDISLTKKIQEAGKLLDIHLLDHIILTDEGHTSLLESGIIK
jgi:DNA repair protein RadC